MANVASTYNDWKRLQLDVGCVFARQIAFNPSRVGQSVEVIGASSSPARIAASLDQRVSKLVAVPSVSAAAMIMPGLTSLADLLKMAVALRSKAGWNITMTELNNSKIGSALAVSITREIPAEGGAAIPSEALVLGPFNEFPLTRRAPSVAMEIYVGKPRVLDPKTNQPVTKANLAHIDMRLPTDNAFKMMWDRSVTGRLISLGGAEDSRAKAKIAFVVPQSLAESFGYWP